MLHDDKSTSPLQLCGDAKLSIKEKINYIWLNYKNNKLKFGALDERINFVKYTPKIRNDDVRQIDGIPPSPARLLSNEFWQDFDFDLLLQSNGPLKVLEVGCGTGLYGLELQRRLGDNLKLYRGIDILQHPTWGDMPCNFEFHQGRAEDISTYLAGIDLVITQSAVEHFEEDLTFFNQIANYVSNANHEVWQIHLLPSAECLITYLWHGYRQYNHVSLSKITKLFSCSSNITLYSLGGSYANKLHLLMITIPNILLRVDLRVLFSNLYRRMLIKSLDKDLKIQSNTTSFYSLVIKSEKSS